MTTSLPSWRVLTSKHDYIFLREFIVERNISNLPWNLTFEIFGSGEFGVVLKHGRHFLIYLCTTSKYHSFPAEKGQSVGWISPPPFTPWLHVFDEEGPNYKPVLPRISHNLPHMRGFFILSLYFSLVHEVELFVPKANLSFPLGEIPSCHFWTETKNKPSSE